VKKEFLWGTYILHGLVIILNLYGFLSEIPAEIVMTDMAVSIIKVVDMVVKELL
jgi:hypothetical protein